MKNKFLTAALFVFVIVLWGTIIFKIISKDNTDTLPVTGVSTMQNEGSFLKKDTFSLLLNYSNPFGTGRSKPSYSGSAIASQPRHAADVQKKNRAIPKSEWPEIIYVGNVKNSKTEKERFIFQVNQVERILAKGEVIDGLKVLYPIKDSIVVSYNKEKRTIGKRKN